MALPATFVPGFHDEEAVRKMKYNTLGKTGLKVSVLSLGTAGFSSCFYGDYNFEECKKIVHEAVRKGINYIDTAPYYGYGVAEEVLGKCLEGIPREAYYIATKVGRYEKDPKLMFDFSKKKTSESIDKSLQRLGLKYVDILQVHDIEYAPTPEIVPNETLPTVQEIVKSGKARFIGITSYFPTTLVECLEKSKVPIDTLLCYSRQTMIDDTLSSFIPILEAKGLGIINAAVNMQGLLSNQGPPEWQAAHQEMKDACTVAREYCKKNNVELGKLAVHHSFQVRGAHTVLAGINKLYILYSDLDVLYNGLSQKEEEVYQYALSVFQKLKVKHWEPVELERYREALKS